MGCSCGINKAPSTVIEPAKDTPHEIRPGESCAFCAEKHVSAAYTSAMLNKQIGYMIGELELARRHTSLEYKELSSMIAELEYLYCMRNIPEARNQFPSLLKAISDVTAVVKPDEHYEESTQYIVKEVPDPVKNPFIGEVHTCAAWRLASEVGYMVPNRHMIIGDLAMAQEQLTRFDYGLNTNLRELRHRVETIKAADLHISWPRTARAVDALITPNLDKYKESYSADLRAYLELS